MKKRLFLVLALAVALIFGGCAEIDAPSSGNDKSGAAESVGASEALPADTSAGTSADTSAAPSEDTSADASAVASADTNPSASPALSEDTSGAAGGDEVLHFLACPDNIIHPSVYYNALQKAAAKAGVAPDYSDLQRAAYDFAPMYDNIRPLIANADLAYINVETLIGGNENPINGYPMFNSPEAAGETLLDLGFDIFNLAHNHMLDSGDDRYLCNCARFFRKRGGTTIGYYENKADTDNIVVVERKGVKIAFLAYTYGTNGITLRPSVATYIPYIDGDMIHKQMRLAKERADLVFVSMHWGDEDSFAPNNMQRQTAQLLADEGADVIIGMHTHTIQEAKWVQRKDGKRCFLVYSLGNLVSGMYGGKNALGALLSLDVVAKAGRKPYVDNVRLLPTVCHYVKRQSVNPKMDTGFRDFKIYFLEDYTEELASAHGCRQNKGKISSFDNELDGNFSLGSLYAKTRRIFPAEFLPDSITAH